MNLRLLPPATKLRQGNIFTSVCQEFCPQGSGGLCPSMHHRSHDWGVSGGVSVQRGLCPGGLCPGGSLSKGVSVWGVSVQGGDLCPVGSLLGRPPYGNELAVRILLECISCSK